MSARLTPSRGVLLLLFFLLFCHKDWLLLFFPCDDALSHPSSSSSISSLSFASSYIGHNMSLCAPKVCPLLGQLLSNWNRWKQGEQMKGAVSMLPRLSHDPRYNAASWSLTHVYLIPKTRRGWRLLGSPHGAHPLAELWLHLAPHPGLFDSQQRILRGKSSYSKRERARKYLIHTSVCIIQWNWSECVYVCIRHFFTGFCLPSAWWMLLEVVRGGAHFWRSSQKETTKYIVIISFWSAVEKLSKRACVLVKKTRKKN